VAIITLSPIPNIKDISSTGSVGPTPTKICPEAKFDFNSMKKTLEEEDTLLEAGTIETRDVESKDTLFWLMSTIICCKAMAI
jgi:hypothetical protein